ncbi:hypothetical protein BURMUCF2_A0230 [Burkholderia multivorans CF2]|nr:hypothetical protein BURMUCF2_A0230 [Burkholderia multivorans CF2]
MRASTSWRAARSRDAESAADMKAVGAMLQFENLYETGSRLALACLLS